MRTLKNAIGYIRVLPDSKENNSAIELQKVAILLYADKHGYTIVEWKICSASGEEEHEAFNENLINGDISNPPYEALVIYNNDSLTPDTNLYFYYLYALAKKRVELLCVKENFAEGEEAVKLCRDVVLFVLEQERRQIALNPTKRRSVRAKCGGYSGGRAPYGYKVENGKLVINEEERPIVEFVFAEKKKGTPHLTIADKLNEAGFKTRKGTKFQNTSVKSIVSNEPFYHGLYKYGKDMNWVKGVHEPIFKYSNEDSEVEEVTSSAESPKSAAHPIDLNGILRGGK